MKTNLYLIVFTLFISLLGCNSTDKKTSETQPKDKIDDMPKVDPIKRGEQLVNSIGCHDCHTPKKFSEKGMELDLSKLLAGHIKQEGGLPEFDQETAKSYVLFTPDLTATIGPWGTTYAANLTPDDTGIGTWSEEQFINAMKNGKYKGLDGSRPILPPMPWQSYRNFSDDDLKAIFAYLKSIDPVENLVPSAILAQAPPK